jgi:hypothetical protein
MVGLHRFWLIFPRWTGEALPGRSIALVRMVQQSPPVCVRVQSRHPAMACRDRQRMGSATAEISREGVSVFETTPRR